MKNVFRIILFVIAAVTLAASARAADYYQMPPPRPPVVIAPPAPLIIEPVEPRCSTEVEINHDDILDTNDSVTRELCDWRIV